MSRLSSFTSSQPHCLTILLQLRDQLVPLANNLRILFVLIVRSVCLDDAVDPIYGAWDTIRSNEFGEIAVIATC